MAQWEKVPVQPLTCSISRLGCKRGGGGREAFLCRRPLRAAATQRTGSWECRTRSLRPEGSLAAARGVRLGSTLLPSKQRQ